jgi:hypothetical protein
MDDEERFQLIQLPTVMQGSGIKEVEFKRESDGRRYPRYVTDQQDQDIMRRWNRGQTAFVWAEIQELTTPPDREALAEQRRKEEEKG